MHALLVLPLILLANGPHKVKIAVPDMRVAGAITPETANLLTDVIAKGVADARPDRMQVITSTMMQSILGLERQKQLLGCKEDTSCLVEVGNALGADLLVSCTLGKLGSTFLLSCSLIDLGKTEADVTVQDSFSGPDDALIGSARKVGGQIGQAVNNRIRAADAAAAAAAKPPVPVAAPGTAVATVPPGNPPPKPAAPAAPPAPLTSFEGKVPGFPYDQYPPPRLDPDVAARYLRSHP